MTTPTDKSPTKPPAEAATEPAKRPLSPEAQRALKEAEERRAAAAATEAARQTELGGQAGPEPTRYGDWEKRGIVSDF
jgi:hypothetical protein